MRKFTGAKNQETENHRAFIFRRTFMSAMQLHLAKIAKEQQATLPDFPAWWVFRFESKPSNPQPFSQRFPILRLKRLKVMRLKIIVTLESERVQAGTLTSRNLIVTNEISEIYLPDSGAGEVLKIDCCLNVNVKENLKINLRRPLHPCHCHCLWST